MTINRSKGFTLIELLVVIAIIGILSAVVLASLNTARSKGNDAAVKANLDTIRTQSAIYYDNENGYSEAGTAITAITAGSCTGTGVDGSILADSNVAAAIAAADAASTGAAVCSLGAATVTPAAQTSTWAVYVPLSTGSSPAGWCVDSTGKSQASALITGAGCP